MMSQLIKITIILTPLLLPLLSWSQDESASKKVLDFQKLTTNSNNNICEYPYSFELNNTGHIDKVTNIEEAGNVTVNNEGGVIILQYVAYMDINGKLLYSPEESEKFNREEFERITNIRYDELLNQQLKFEKKIEEWDKILSFYAEELKKLSNDDPVKVSGFKTLENYSENVKTAKCLAEDYINEAQISSDSKGERTYLFDLEKLENDPNYRSIGPEIEGFRLVKKFNKFGFMTQSSNLSDIPYLYDYATNFTSGLAIVQEKDVWCVIDKNNTKQVFLPNSINNIISFNGQIIIYKDTKGNEYLKNISPTPISNVYIPPPVAYEKIIPAYSGSKVFFGISSEVEEKEGNYLNLTREELNLYFKTVVVLDSTGSIIIKNSLKECNRSIQKYGVSEKGQKIEITKNPKIQDEDTKRNLSIPFNVSYTNTNGNKINFSNKNNYSTQTPNYSNQNYIPYPNNSTIPTFGTSVSVAKYCKAGRSNFFMVPGSPYIIFEEAPLAFDANKEPIVFRDEFKEKSSVTTYNLATGSSNYYYRFNKVFPLEQFSKGLMDTTWMIVVSKSISYEETIPLKEIPDNGFPEILQKTQTLANYNMKNFVWERDLIGVYSVKYDEIVLPLKFDKIYQYINEENMFIIGKFFVSKKSNNLVSLKGVTTYNDLQIVPPIFSKINLSNNTFIAQTSSGNVFKIDFEGNCIEGDCTLYKKIIAGYYNAFNK